MESKAPGDATRLLAEISKGDRAAIEQLMPIVYDELRSLAEALMLRERSGHTLQPTALVHEAFVRLIGPEPVHCHNRNHFMAVAARAMRRILVNHALARKAKKRSPGAATIQLNASDTPTPEREVDTVALDDALNNLARLDKRKAQVVELRFFGGMTVSEVSDVMKISVSTVEADWRLARAWLSQALADE